MSIHQIASKENTVVTDDSQAEQRHWNPKFHLTCLCHMVIKTCLSSQGMPAFTILVCKDLLCISNKTNKYKFRGNQGTVGHRAH